MEVKLLMGKHHLEMMEYNAAYAMLTCHANTDKLKDEPPSEFLKRAMKAHHDTVLEHIWLTYEVGDFSRTCLQELARHRHITLSVESTRHTLSKQLLNNTVQISLPDDMDEELRGVIGGYLLVHVNYMKSHPDTPNDHIKYAIPECVCTNLIMTANVREMRHIASLRTSPAALKEFQDLARKFVDVVPERFRYLLEDCVHHGNGNS